MSDTVRRVAIVQWPDGLSTASDAWSGIEDAIDEAGPDILITNELPFGAWVAASQGFVAKSAARSIAEHEFGNAALRALGLPAVVSSRPVAESGRLANEAVLIEKTGITGFHRKQYFPQEPGWYESAWYGTGSREFRTIAAAGIELGALLCTEAMFNEHARQYGRAGAQLIAIPRATGTSVEMWHLAARMAALVSGCYVASSNRVGSGTPNGPLFGGEGFAYAPNGALIGTTCADRPLLLFDLDTARVSEARTQYPRYVSEREAAPDAA